MPTALIDADVLRYEIGAIGETINPDTLEKEIRSFDFVKDKFDERIQFIMEGSGCDSYHLFITDDPKTHKIAKRSGLLEGDFIPNFRDIRAEEKAYKGTRSKDKPFHWINLTAYILADKSTQVAVGCEADDLIAIRSHSKPSDYIICTRDKDLRMVPGVHYGWECGKQAEFGPVTYDSLGAIELIRSKSGNKIRGGGWAFFCSQLLTGDVVDNIGGAKGVGPVRAYELLKDCSSHREYFSTVVSEYKDRYGSSWKEALAEQCALLWIIRDFNEDGSLRHFNLEQWIN